MSDEVRRIVTGHDATGKAIVLTDGAAPRKTVRTEVGLISRLMWVTDQSPADMAGDTDRGNRDIGIPPPAKGTVFRIVDFLPMTAEMEKKGAEYMAARVGHDHPTTGKFRPPRHAFMHRTKSVDYALVLSGEIDMLLDDSEVHMKAGDVMVQQGTNHAWVNRGKEVCRIAFVLVDANDP